MKMIFMIVTITSILFANITAIAASISNDKGYTDWLRTGGKDYPYKEFVGEVAVHWSINGDKINLAIAAESIGWVGFGLSEVGGMKGADIIIFNSETKTLVDAHSLDYTTPVEDVCQDWTLKSYNLTGNVIIFEAVRDLETFKSHDHPFRDDSNTFSPATRVIVAWGDQRSPSYHGPNRASGRIRFFQKNMQNNTQDIMVEEPAEETFTIDFVANNYAIPEKETTYADFCFTSSDLEELGISLADESHYLKAHYLSDKEFYIHHMILYASNSEDKNCDSVYKPIWLWAPGVDDFVLPDNVGILFGGDTGFKTVRLEIHYNNPKYHEGIIDNSGVRVTYTKQLRIHNAGVFQIGDPDISLIGIPLGKGWSQWDFNCPGTCTEKWFPNNVTVFRELLHMHELGQRMKSTYFDSKRSSKKETIVDYYEFRISGAYDAIQEPYNVQPGDSFDVTCYYYDEEKKSRSVFGVTSKAEMCVNFIWYYPAVSNFHSACGANIGYDRACSGGYSPTSLKSEGEIERKFGEPEICDLSSSMSHSSGKKYYVSTSQSFSSTSQKVAVTSFLILTVIFNMF